MLFLILFILLSPCFGWNTEHDFYMPAAAAAYSDDPSQCWTNISAYYINTGQTVTFTIYRQYTVKCNSWIGTCYAYIAVVNYSGDRDPSVLTVFRGTNNNYQFIENGWNYDEMVPFVAGGKVCKVLFDEFNVLWNSGMKDDLLTLKNKYYPKIKFHFVGHSIGGAMASFAAGTFKQLNNNCFVSLHTYGQPRVGDKDFAIAVNNLGFDQSYRITHKADIVPHLPPLNQSVYYHHLTKLWYNNDMGNVDFELCDNGNGEDSECSNSLPDTEYNMKDHKHYFGRKVIEYGKNGCPDLGTSQTY